ncbi:MAG: chitosanase [Chloroflexi bacterium]|nr:chitosanase [Chloroflexota bacterium]MCC6893011.1 chitosanase [Anaerolineae bacterium]
MSISPFLITVRGIPSSPIVNVRIGPNTSYAKLVELPVGTPNLAVLEVRADDKNTQLQGRTYQWLRCTLPNGQNGWIRDDLVTAQGDGTRFGYPIVVQPILVADLTRKFAPVGVSTPPTTVSAPAAPVTPPTPPAPAVAPPAPPAPAAAAFTAASVPAAPAAVSTAPAAAPIAPNVGSLDRVRRSSFAITSAFEGGGYATYQTYDSGIISYGRFQFTLASGSFMTVINRYLQRTSGPTVDGIRGYLPRLNAKDEALRQDAGLKTLCINAASDPIMQAIQDEVATEGYWGAVIDLSIAPRNIKSALGYALIFDMSIQHGKYNFLVPKAETDLGVPNKSRLGENGITEPQYLTKLAQLRRENLYALADKLKLPGLRFRGDFWVSLVSASDWNLQGDTNGNVNINGKIVQVRTPA